MGSLGWVSPPGCTFTFAKEDRWRTLFDRNMAETALVLRLRRRTVELDHHMRLCDMRPLASTKVWEQVYPTWRQACALTYEMEATVERLRFEDKHDDTPYMVHALQPSIPLIVFPSCRYRL